MTCRVIRVSRAAHYAWRRARTAEVGSETRVRAHIRGLHRGSRGTYGSPRVTASLRKQGVLANHKRVQTGGSPLAGGGPLWPAKAVLSRVDDGLGACASRSAECPDAILLSTGPQRPMGRRHHVPAYRERAGEFKLSSQHPDSEARQGAGIVPSMIGKGNCWNNAVAESFFWTYEQELGGRALWTSVAQARLEVGRWIQEFYNDESPHSTLGFRSPVEYETIHLASMSGAA
jgi:putative transposase